MFLFKKGERLDRRYQHDDSSFIQIQIKG